MNLTVQIVTKNNSQQLRKTLASLQPLKAQVVINDLGSTDDTVAIGESAGVIVKHHQLENDYSRLRNRLTEESTTPWNMYMFPGETLVQGHQQLKKTQFSAYYLPIFSGQTLRKEIRVWNKERGFKFKNPVFETLDCETEHEFNAPIYSNGYENLSDQLSMVQIWRDRTPTNPDPYYYEACCLLGLGKTEQFERVSEHYMFLEDKKNSMASIMNRYYYALVQLNKEKVRPTLQNINLCICVRPLMAEFWCVMGDVYYHLLHKFDKAKSFYENAIILGSRRKANDKWPMDISKYKTYPNQMIASCDKFLTSFAVYEAKRA